MNAKIVLFFIGLEGTIIPCAAMQIEPDVDLIRNGTSEKLKFVATLRDPVNNRVIYGKAHYEYSFEAGPVIDRLYIYPLFRKQGYGTFLLNYVLNHFRQLNFGQVVLTARAFEAHGYFNDEQELLTHQITKLPKLIHFYKERNGIVLKKDKREAIILMPTSVPVKKFNQV